MPPSFSTTKRNTMANAPSAKILPFTMNPADLSVGFQLKQPLKMSSRRTAAVEFSTTDKELQQICENG